MATSGVLAYVGFLLLRKPAKELFEARTSEANWYQRATCIAACLVAFVTYSLDNAMFAVFAGYSLEVIARDRGLRFEQLVAHGATLALGGAVLASCLF